jgi:hypothetical protein
MNNIAQVHSQSSIHDSQQLSKASKLQRPGGSLPHPRREYLEMCDNSIFGLGEGLLVMPYSRSLRSEPIWRVRNPKDCDLELQTHVRAHHEQQMRLSVRGNNHSICRIWLNLTRAAATGRARAASGEYLSCGMEIVSQPQWWSRNLDRRVGAL